MRESYAELERKVELRTAELTESLAYQTAISEVLRVISESPTDVQPVFEAILDCAVRLLGSPTAAVFRYDGRHGAPGGPPQLVAIGRRERRALLPRPAESANAQRPGDRRRARR